MIGEKNSTSFDRRPETNDGYFFLVSRILGLFFTLSIANSYASVLPNCAGTATVDGKLVPDGQPSQWTSNTWDDSTLQGSNINNKV